MSAAEHPPRPWDLDVRAVFEASPTPYLFLDAQLRVLDANPAYLATTGHPREALVGRGLFEVFPDGPGASGVGSAALRASLERARDTGRPDPVALLHRHDIPVHGSDRSQERWWSAITVPLHDSSGAVTVLAHRAEDVTDYVRSLPPTQRREDGSPVDARLPSAAVRRAWLDSRSGLRRRARELQEANAHLQQEVAAGRSVAVLLQQAMLTELPEPDHLHLVAAYAPAAEHQEVGGDWYDAFQVADGATTLVIGDVTGHDLAAAAQMGALRNVLRTTAYLREEPPSLIVRAAERVVTGLGMDVLATLVLLRVEQTPEDRARGLRTVRWTNAGHPPPLLLLPDGRVRRLDSPPELLLGLPVVAQRSDHVAEVPAGSTLLLYTDGLVERRGRSLEDGIRALEAALAAAADVPVAELLEHLRLVSAGAHHDDDIATLAVRFHDQDAPRPPEAGPRHDPTSTGSNGPESTDGADDPSGS